MNRLTERQALVLYHALVYHDENTIGGEHLTQDEKSELKDALGALCSHLQDMSHNLRIGQPFSESAPG
jgi:hypothetical protein